MADVILLLGAIGTIGLPIYIYKAVPASFIRKDLPWGTAVLRFALATFALPFLFHWLLTDPSLGGHFGGEDKLLPGLLLLFASWVVVPLLNVLFAVKAFRVIRDGVPL